MPAPISNVVNVTITRNTVFPTGPGFGTLLVVGPNSTGVIPLAERIRFYGSIAEVGADFASTTEEYKAALSYFSANPRPTKIAIGVRDDSLAAGAIAGEMDAIVNASDDWYGVCLAADGRISDDASTPTELAAWAESKSKLFVTASNEAAAIAAGGGLPGGLFGLGYARTASFYHPNASNGAGNAYPEAAFFGQMLTVDFDGVDTVKTGKFRTLPGVPVTELTQAERAFLLANNGNAYINTAGTPMVEPGIMASGEFFDVMHGLDWLQSEIGFRVFGRLATMRRVPYTDAGIEILVSEVRGALRQAVRNGLIATQFDDSGERIPAFEVSAPSILTVSSSDRAARKAPPISFTARLSGAVHTVAVHGDVIV